MELLRFATAGSVDDGKSTLIGRLLHVLELVLEDLLGVVEQAADQGRLAVVDRAGGGEADQLGGLDGAGRVAVRGGAGQK